MRDTTKPKEKGKKGATIKVAVVSHHTLLREGIEKLLNREKHIKTVGQATNLPEIINPKKTYGAINPDVLVLDVEMPELDLPRVLSSLNGEKGSTKILLLVKDFDEGRLINFIRIGARGYVRETEGSQKLIEAIKAVKQGRIFADKVVAAKASTAEPLNSGEKVNNSNSSLTKREKKIVALILKGLSNKAIASRLQLSQRTVGSHLYSIFRKLGVGNRLQLALYVFRHNDFD